MTGLDMTGLDMAKAPRIPGETGHPARWAWVDGAADVALEVIWAGLSVSKKTL
jgi:hypothetical protein